MALDRDYLGEKLRLVERAREDAYFRKLDQELIDNMRQQTAAQEVQAVEDEGRPEPAFSSILVPVDFSPYSRRALEQAADLADRFHASIIALHVIDAEVGVQVLASRLGISVVNPAIHEREATADISDDEIKTVLDHQREQAYEALQAFLPPSLASYPLELRVVFGRPFERIIETAVKTEVGLIVMGTHGRTGLAHMALGSIAERVVRLAPCSVLTVKVPSPESESWLKTFYNTFLGIGS
jgi:nucleotide-binding universal stress UspA family protein